MKRRILALFVALALVVGVAGSVVVTTEEPASAHNESTLSYWYCSKHRSNTGMTVIHSWESHSSTGFKGYTCIEDFFGNSYMYSVLVSPPGSNNSWLNGPRYHCWPHGPYGCSAPH